jgi:hypothetical protein
MSDSSEIPDDEPIPFEAFANFERLNDANPIIACDPPEWAAATHAFVRDETIHYLWGRREEGNYWVLMHSTAPASNPSEITHDERNPVLLPSDDGFDDHTIEYPFPFLNPADGRHYVYYLGRRKKIPKQTGLLVGDGYFGKWERVRESPVIAADTAHESAGSSHPPVTVVEILSTSSTPVKRTAHRPSAMRQLRPVILQTSRKIQPIQSSEARGNGGTAAGCARRRSSEGRNSSTSSTAVTTARPGGQVRFGLFISVRSNPILRTRSFLPRPIPMPGIATGS